jgi:hypothetical protein
MVSRQWYSKASDKSPATGRLYHHLAILARPNALQQLFFYVKCLCVLIPFAPARDSIMTLFDPIMNSTSAHHPRLIQIDATFVKGHGILFSGKSSEEFPAIVDEFIASLDHHIGRTTRRWMESGYGWSCRPRDVETDLLKILYCHCQLLRAPLLWKRGRHHLQSDTPHGHRRSC